MLLLIPETNLRRQIAKVRDHPWVPKTIPARGFIYDVRTGRLNELKRAMVDNLSLGLALEGLGAGEFFINFGNDNRVPEHINRGTTVG